MNDVEDSEVGVDRRRAAGRVASWFEAELGALVNLLRQTVESAPPERAKPSDQVAAESVQAAARACSARVSLLLGLRAEPLLTASSNPARELAGLLSQEPRLQGRGVLEEGLALRELPLPAASLRSILRALLDNACEAASAPAQLGLVKLDHGGTELRVTSASTLSPEHAAQALFPFFTTKRGHRGLGLPLAHIAAENQGGRLELLPDSAGVRARVTFPGQVSDAAEAESDVTFACHLAATLAHDVNNALMAALGWAEILGDARDQAERDEALSTLSQAADYLEAMSYLLPHTGTPDGGGPALDLEHALDRMRPLLRAVLEHKADRKIALCVRSVAGARVSMSESALRSVVLKLAESARDSMPHGGTWTISCDVQPRNLLLTLAGDGRGTDLASDSARKLRAPKQTALALAVAKDLVRAIGGTLDLDTPSQQTSPNPSARIRLPSGSG